MDFQQLLAKMQQLDQPVGEAQVSECPPDMPPAPMATQQPETPPSMSVNLNAQGMENIESILKLIAKVNPDTVKPADASLPSAVSSIPSISSVSPLKMLPDLDKEPEEMPELDNEPGDDLDNDSNKIDIVKIGDDAEEKKDEWANSPDEEVSDISAAIPDGNDLNKKKASFSDKPYRGDNPMAAESTDLRSQIRAELQRRLNEAKGAK